MWKRFGSAIDRPLSFIEKSTIFIGCILLWGIFALVLLQMLGRVVLRTGLPWPEELARYFHIVLVFIGLAFAHRLRNHVDMQFFAQNWSPRVQRVTGAIVELAIIVASIVIIVGGIALIQRMGLQRSPSLGLPLVLFIGPTIIGFGLLALQAFRQLLLKFSPDDAVALPGKKEHLEL